MTTSAHLGRWLAVAAVLITGTIVGIGVPAPAHAASAALRAPDGILFRDCARHPVRVAVSVPSSAREWVANVAYYGTDGEYSGVQTRTGRSSGTRTTHWTFCLNADEPGVHEMRMFGYWTDAAGEIHNFTPRSTTFRMRPARSRTTVAVSDRTPHPGERVTVRSRTIEERPGGRWGPSDYAYVRLQRRTTGPWRTVEERFVGDDGVVRWQYVVQTRSDLSLRAFAHDLQGVRPSTAVVRLDVQRGG